MNLKKKDREKVDIIVDNYTEAFVWCFNEDYTNKYLERFTLMKYESGLYNNDFTHAGLDIFNDNDITDTYDGIEDEEINQALKTYFVKTFKKSLKEKLPKHFEELRKQKKEEKAKEDEAKGKKGKK